jgi:hypothetical protein
MGSLRWALALWWLMVGAVGLAPILVYWVAGLIGGAFRSKRADRGTGSRPAGKEGEEPAERPDTATPG